ncbi:MAG: histidine--tRNA ligase [bacterium]|nr:histidine--tRNA ligase [bacterium]
MSNKEKANEKVSAPKGTRDIFYPDVAKWQYVEEEIRNFFSQFLYKEIRTPIFEHSELFQRGIGSETEVVQKEMYTFIDKGERSLTLRPENTASVVRAAIENNLFNEMFPLRFLYIGPMFRYEKPQKGRQRQFHQMGIEVFGDDSPGVDAEVIYSAYKFLERIHINDIELHVNSVGCPECRPGFLKKLEAEAGKHREHLCADCQRKINTNPLRIFDCKKKQCIGISDDFPKITDNLCEECDVHFGEVKKSLALLEVDYTLNPRMVRGLDYYTKTAFEITSGQLGAQDAVLGGGRYDQLVKDLGGPDIVGIGFAGGLERMILHIDDTAAKEDNVVLVAYQNQSLEAEAVKLTKILWEKGVTAYVSYNTKNMKKQFKRGDRIGAVHTFILGEDEIQNNTISIKSMATREQVNIKREELDQWLKTNIKTNR